MKTGLECLTRALQLIHPLGDRIITVAAIAFGTQPIFRRKAWIIFAAMIC